MQTIEDKDQEALINGHLERLRGNELLARALIVTIIEANLAWVTVRCAYLWYRIIFRKKSLSLLSFRS